MQLSAFKFQALEWQRRYYAGQRLWSAAYYSSVYGSIVASLLSAALLQFKQDDVSPFAAILSSMAAALTSFATVGGFRNKWKSNRLSRSKIDCLLLDLKEDGSNIQELQQRLKDIISNHDNEIVADIPDKKSK